MADFSDLFDFSSVAPDPQMDEEGGGGPTEDNAPIRSSIPPKAELAVAITQTAKNLGIDPVDLATAISYETGGKFSTSMMGGAGGNYMGLIQFGPNERKQYGASPDQSPAEQMQAVERYLRDRGLKPGMGMLDLYSTINAGRPGLYNRSDAANGGAPGTVADKVNYQMADHRKAAQALLADYLGNAVADASPQPDASQAIRIRPVSDNPPPMPAPAPTPVPQQPLATPAPTPTPQLDVASMEQMLKQLAQPAPLDNAPPAVADPNQGIGQIQLAQNTPQPPQMKVPSIASASDPSASAPSPPISGPQDITYPPQAQIPQAPQQNPAPAPDLATETAAQARQVGSGILKTATALPMDAAAALAAGVALPARALGYEGPAKVFSMLKEEANKMRAGSDFATGALPPTTPGQQLAQVVGRNIMPSVGGTAFGVGTDLLTSLLTNATASAKPLISKPDAEQVLFPQQGLPGPRVTHTIMTAGGPARVGDDSLKTLGIFGAVTLGALFAPRVLSKIASMRLPTYRPVENAAPGTVTISNRVDLARTYDDVNAGILRTARRAGMDPATLADITDKFQIQTGSAARSLVNSAVTSGRMETPNFTFKAPVPLAEIATADNPQVRDYLHARDTFDDVLQKEAALAKQSKSAQAQQAALGPVTVRGLTKQDALDIVNNLEKVNPGLKQIADAYAGNVKAMREFMYRGEYGTLSNKEFKELAQTSKNYVPWLDADGATQRNLVDPSIERASPFQALREEMMPSLRKRMENEVKGSFIDAMRKIDEGFFTKVTAKEVRENPNWQEKGNLVKMYRRGKPEYYTTDKFYADVLDRDPYAITSIMPLSIYASKRLFESTATGALAPWFSMTSAIRSHKLITQSVNGVEKAPWAWQTMIAVPQQLLPQAAKAVGDSLNRGSAGWLVSTFGSPTMDALAKTMGKSLIDAHNNSLYGRLETVGSYHGSFMDNQAAVVTPIAKVRDMVTGAPKAFLNGYLSLINSVHNAPAFAYARRNVNEFPLPELAMRARDITGDPTITGQFYNGRRAISISPKPLLGSDTLGKAATLGTQAYGLTTEIGRHAVPWFNITTQGTKRVAEAYVNNPSGFISKFATYTLAPTAALYFYTRGLGLDPNGKSYADYKMNGRSEYAKTMNTYIPIPGRPAEDGIEIPRVQEFSGPQYMFEAGLDHLMRSDVGLGTEDMMRTALSMVGAGDKWFPPNNGGATFSSGEDFQQGLANYGDVTVGMPMLPLGSLVMATKGVGSTSNMFSGESYHKTTDPYDQTGGLSAKSELVARALATGTADIVGSMYAAFHQTPEGLIEGLKNGMKEGSKRAIMKTPLVRDLMGLKPPETGSTRIGDELFKKEKVLNNLSKYFRTWDASKGNGQINTKLASGFGEGVVLDKFGPAPPSERAGLAQPTPTNPLYLQFMKEVYDKTNADTPKSGGIGFKSLWRRYGDYSEQVKSLRNINAGNNVTWQMQLANRPEQLKELKGANVDYRDPRAVKDYYEDQRQAVMKELLFTIRAIEESMSARVGRPVHVEDLDPYADQPQAGDVLAPQPQIPPWADGTGTP